jgi:SAM-dependent methyltransferase
LKSKSLISSDLRHSESSPTRREVRLLWDEAQKVKSMKEMIKRVPVLGDIAKRIHDTLAPASKTEQEPFPGSAEYWEKRYSTGGDSGVGSYGFFAEFKADVLNDFVSTHGVQTVIEFGCGDGNQLTLAKYPSYVGFDVSSTVLSQCREKFKSDPSKSFRLVNEYSNDTADLTMSLDVIYHLVEDGVFAQYMQTLFRASNRYVIIYASDTDDNSDNAGTHVRHRKFTQWVQQNLTDWKLSEHIKNRYPYKGDYRKGSFADFFVFEKI